MRVPRCLLLVLWAVLTLLAYYVVLVAGWASAYHVGSPLQMIVAEALVVLAAFSCLEVMRTERIVQLRALAGALGFPLVMVALVTLWLGLRRHLGF